MFKALRRRNISRRRNGERRLVMPCLAVAEAVAVAATMCSPTVGATILGTQTTQCLLAYLVTWVIA